VTCELSFLGGCSGRIHRHHIVNRSRTRGNAAARKFVDANGWLFWADVCEAHNVGRMADTRGARAHFLSNRIVRYGRAPVETCLADLRNLFRSDASDLTIEGLIG